MLRRFWSRLSDHVLRDLLGDDYRKRPHEPLDDADQVGVDDPAFRDAEARTDLELQIPCIRERLRPAEWRFFLALQSATLEEGLEGRDARRRAAELCGLSPGSIRPYVKRVKAALEECRES
jgi:hypothetical protein